MAEDRNRKVAPVKDSIHQGLAEALRDHATLAQGLRRRRSEWRQTAVIHGDVRWDNAIVESGGGRERIVLVDWEFLDRGEAGWDVAGALADAVSFEAMAAYDETEARAPTVSAEQLAALRGAVGPFVDTWAQAYRAAAPPESGEADLQAGLRLLPARVLGIAFLHAAWGQEAGLGSALWLAAVATALMEEQA